MRALVVDHEDSFVYNLVQSIACRGVRVKCVRYTTPVREARAFDPDLIVLSPGPGHPSERDLSHLSRQLLREFGSTRPVLGVCLGHQIIAEEFGARTIRAAAPVHGAATLVYHRGDGLFLDIPSPMNAARYHSLVVDRRRFPSELELDAWGKNGVVMALHHRHRPLFGVQFHPESFLTPNGPALVQNFLNEARR